MRRLRFRTAGESHGKGLLAFLEGLPYGFAPDLAAIDAELARRQGGYGRSGRQQIERDRVEALTGLKRGKTIGAPVALWVGNRDVRIDSYREITRPRPGHADLAGAQKFETDDVADVLERASARETAARVAAGAAVAQILRAAGCDVFAHVTQVGRVLFAAPAAFDRVTRDASPFYGLDPQADGAAASAVDAARAAGDSVGGAFEIVATGLPPGLGSHAQWDERLDGRLGQAVLSIPAVRSVSLGAGDTAAETPGSQFHDAVLPEPASPRGLRRATNRAGGIEGGLTNGEPVVVRAVMKPIPTLLTPLASIDLRTGEPTVAGYERSDVCAVPAASVVAEAMVALVLCDALLEAVGDVPFLRFPEAVAALRDRRRPPALGGFSEESSNLRP
jgi:chorismate synthase